MRGFLKVAGVAVWLSVGATAAIAELTATANRPTYRGSTPADDRLDNCWMLGRNCGQEAADKYCEIHGFERAKSFQTEKASPTQTLVGQRCTGPACVAFKSITCSMTAKERRPTKAWPELIH